MEMKGAIRRGERGIMLVSASKVNKDLITKEVGIPK